MAKWVRVTKKHRCPICLKPDWCAYTEDVVMCMRQESDHPTRNGGWLHRASEDAPRAYIKPPETKEAAIDFASLWLRWFEETDYQRLKTLSSELGVNADALCALGSAWNGKAWAFPMKNANKKIIGIRLRGADGRKWAVKGSKQGLFIPEVDVQPTLYIVEGVSDAAAAVTLGLYAIGRPSCLGCEETIIQFTRTQKIKRVVIIADNDAPGLRGAAKLRSCLPIYSCVWSPPCKDLREFSRLGGNASLIEASVKDLVWERAA